MNAAKPAAARALVVLTMLIAIAAVITVPAAATADGAAKKAPFKGIVQDDKLQPVAGAVVTVVAIPRRAGGDEAEPPMPQGGPGGPGRRMARIASRERAGDTPPPAFFDGRTDASGAFTIEAEGDGTFNLRVQAPGFAPVILEKVKPGEAVSSVFLRKGIGVSGFVADLGTGRAVPDAEIVAMPEEDHGFRDPDDPKRFASVSHTARDGGFTAADLAPGFYSFRVSAPGKAAFEAGDKPVGDGASRPLTFYLEPGFDVSGRVLDPAGKPAARVDVRAQPARRSGGMLRLLTSGGYTPSRARTDKEGKFSVRGLPVEGKFTLEAGGGDFAPASVELPQGKAGVPVTGIEIRLEKALILRAKLVDADQKPVTKGVSASLTYRDPKTRRVLKDVPRSGKDIAFSPAGELTISRLPSGLAGVTLTIEGYKDVERKDVQIGGGDKPADLGTIVLDRGKKIDGRVLDEEGKPIASARVQGSRFAPGSFLSVEAKTDAGGAFTLGGLTEDTVTVEASARGYATARQEEVAPGGQPIELKLGRTGSVKGRVVSGDPPRPLVNFSIEANPKESGGGPMGGFRFMRGAGGGGRNQSDPRGQFTVADLSPGTYTIVCHAEGMQDLVRDGVEVRGGEATELGDLALEAGGTIRGRVISKPEGLPVAGAAVRIKASGLFDMRNIFAGRAEAVLTDMGGRFELRGLPSGQVTIVVEPVNYAKAELAGVTVEAGRETDELTVNVGKGGRIEGRVLADGRPQPNAMVTAMSGLADFSAQLSATTDDQGRYAIENVAPGSYRVASLPGFGGDDEEEGAAGGGGRRGFGGLDTVNTEVKDGETSVVNFGEKKIVVTGSLKRKSGETAKQMVIFIQGGAGRGARMGAQMATTDEAGHYEVTLKEPGEYDVYVGDQGMRGGTAVKATIPDKADVTYDIVVPEGAITGRVTDENGGKPLKGAMVVVSPSLGKDERPSLTSRRGGSRATTGEDGTYRVDGLGAGKYDVTFVMEGYGAETVPAVEVKGTDEMSSLDQPLRAGVPFKVRVSSPGGSGVSGAMVMVSQGGALMQGVTGMTREDGIAELKQLKPGIYSFLALTRDQAPGVLRDVAIGGERDSDTAVVTLSAGGSARIVVQDYGKKGISGATVELQSADGPDLDQMIQLFAMMNGGQGATGGDGALVLDHIPAGKYQAVVTSKDKKVTKSLTVEDGARAELTITLE